MSKNKYIFNLMNLSISWESGHSNKFHFMKMIHPRISSVNTHRSSPLITSKPITFFTLHDYILDVPRERPWSPEVYISVFTGNKLAMTPRMHVPGMEAQGGGFCAKQGAACADWVTGAAQQSSLLFLICEICLNKNMKKPTENLYRFLRGKTLSPRRPITTG